MRHSPPNRGRCVNSPPRGGADDQPARGRHHRRIRLAQGPLDPLGALATNHGRWCQGSRGEGSRRAPASDPPPVRGRRSRRERSGGGLAREGRSATARFVAAASSSTDSTCTSPLLKLDWRRERGGREEGEREVGRPWWVGGMGCVKLRREDDRRVPVWIVG
jgi:hypothetical protein